MIKKVAAVAAAAGGLVIAGSGMAVADTGALASDSSGVVSGNNIQVPVDVPVNVCGNTISVLGVMNPASGSVCV